MKTCMVLRNENTETGEFSDTQIRQSSKRKVLRIQMLHF